MLRKLISNRIMLPVILCFQIVPLVAFPLSSFTVKSQEWWLPVLLACFTIIGLVQLLIRRSQVQWPWYLLSFSQGFNIISRLMMLLPHSTDAVNKVQIFNTDYVVITVACMLVSAFEIWYNEMPEVRIALLGRTRRSTG
jgi:hypothetical protein